MLTDTQARNAKLQARDYSMADANGLRLLVRSSGSKLWQYRFRLAGKASIFSIGCYPDVSIAGARQAAADARTLVEQGINPAQDRKTKKLARHLELATTFQGIAEEWIASKQAKWSPYYSRQVTRFFASDVYPIIGSMPIKQVSAAHILGILKTAETRGAESVAVYLRQWCGAVFRYAVSTLRADADPTQALKGAVTKPDVVHAKALSAQELKMLGDKLASDNGTTVTRTAIKLLMLAVVRTVELRMARWDEFDLEHREWRIPASRMKMKAGHVVPLSKQAVVLLEELRVITGHSPYLFPNTRKPTNCMTGTTINRWLERTGFTTIGFSGHGFRATASTMLNEAGFNGDWIERQLAHTPRNAVRASYNHALYLPERRRMLQWWADACDQMMAGKKLPALKRVA
jgi:integrase